MLKSLLKLQETIKEETRFTNRNNKIIFFEQYNIYELFYAHIIANTKSRIVRSHQKTNTPNKPSGNHSLKTEILNIG